MEIRKPFLERILKLDNVSEVGENFMCSCPFANLHSEHRGGVDEHPSFGINRESGVYNCFTCGERGSFVTLVSKILGIPWKEAQKVVDGRKKEVTSSLLRRRVERFEREPKEKDCSLPEAYTREIPSDIGYDFLYGKRHIFDEVIEHFQLGFCETGLYRGRIIVPVILDGVCKGFLARDVTGKAEKKYLMPSGFQKNSLLFNLDGVDTSTVFLVEGCFDVFQLWQNGVRNAIAIMGSELSRGQVNLLLQKKVKKVVLLFDKDLAGEKAERKAYKVLKPFFQVFKSLLPFMVKDPGDLRDREDVIFVKKHIEPVFGDESVFQDRKVFVLRGRLERLAV